VTRPAPARTRAGQIWLASLDPAVENEQAGTRPCMVVSADGYHAMPIQHVIIVPITTTNRNLPHHIEIDDDGGLDRASYAMPEAIRAVSVRRFRRFLGEASPDTVALVRSVARQFISAPR
jgi:mRNA interferase MazF